MQFFVVKKDWQPARLSHSIETELPDGWSGGLTPPTQTRSRCEGQKITDIQSESGGRANFWWRGKIAHRRAGKFPGFRIDGFLNRVCNL